MCTSLKFITVVLITVICNINTYAEIKPGIYPINNSIAVRDLEPSGLALLGDKILFVSDNDEDRAIFSLTANNDYCKFREYIKISYNDLSKTGKHNSLDLEGIVIVGNDFYLVDERDRFIYRIDTQGRVNNIRHDIIEYNKRNNIQVLSGKDNAGFEAIAYDDKHKIFFIGNEREKAVLYFLKLNTDLNVFYHIILNDFTGISDFDLSDLYFYKNFLYLLHRKGCQILKLDTQTKKIAGCYSFSNIVKDLYYSGDGYGFAEGLALNDKFIYLVLDSNGKNITDRNYGKNGAFIVIDKPKGF